MKRIGFFCLAISMAEILIILAVLFMGRQAQKTVLPVQSEPGIEEPAEEQVQSREITEEQEGSGEEGEDALGTTASGDVPEAVPAGAALDELLMRVKLKNSDYTSYVQTVVTISCEGTMCLQGGNKEQIYTGGQTVSIDPEFSLFSEGMITVTSKDSELYIESIVHRGESHTYQGKLELYREGQGIVVINELPLEDYVSRVVPSEMPASYGLEAAKLQAVCARTYAYERIFHGKTIDSYGAYADDSVDYQVYNSAGYQEVSAEGTRQTKGIILTCQGAPVVPYYFSTSCGYTTDNLPWSDSGTPLPYLASRNLTDSETLDLRDEAVFADFIRDWQRPALEQTMAWYRWKCYIDCDTLVTLLSQRVRQIYRENSGRIVIDGAGLEEILASDFQGLSVNGRYEGGMVSQIGLEYEAGNILASGELNIRRLLGEPDRCYINLSQEGGGTSEGDYLPSAFFCIEEQWSRQGTEQGAAQGEQDLGVPEGYAIYGGGNGHGIGLSQNAAYAMLSRGDGWKQVLDFFYPGTVCVQIP